MKRYVPFREGKEPAPWVVFDLLTGEVISPRFGYKRQARRRCRYLNALEKKKDA